MGFTVVGADEFLGSGHPDARSDLPPLLDLAIDPDDPDRIVVSGERGLLVSSDAGATWRPLSHRVTGLLAWTDALTVVDPTGAVLTFGPDLGDFERVSQVDGEPAAMATNQGELLLALHDNSVVSSADGGRSWKSRLAGGVS